MEKQGPKLDPRPLQVIKYEIENDYMAQGKGGTVGYNCIHLHQLIVPSLDDEGPPQAQLVGHDVHCVVVEGQAYLCPFWRSHPA